MIDLLRQPHYRFSGAVDGTDVDRLMRLAALEHFVPGALVYGFVEGSRKRHRLVKVMEASEQPGTFTSFEAIVVAHGAFLVEACLSGWGFATTRKAGCGADSVGGFPQGAELEAAEARGLTTIRELGSKSILHGNIVEQPRPWQKSGVSWALSRPWVTKVWPTGTGKTAGALADAAAVVVKKHWGDIVIACPGGARPTWLTQTPEYLCWEAHMVKPESQRRKSDEGLVEYVGRCRKKGQPAVVIVGFENLADHIDAFEQVLEPTVLIIDEIHKCGSHARWTASYQKDGSVTFKPKKTDNGKINQAVAIMRLSSLSTLRFRCGMTATPLGEGRPRRLWSQMDLLSRGGFGYSYWNTFVRRYCGGEATAFGIDDTGQTHSRELTARLRYMAHEVPYSETRKGMPPLTVNVVRLPKELQVRPERFDQDRTFNQAIKGALKEAAVADPGDRQGLLKRGRTVEYRLMEACSRKRKWVIDRALEGLRGGGKVVIFTGRRAEVAEWKERVERAMQRGDEQVRGFRAYGYHGGNTDSERAEILSAFKSGEGPLLLVATGQSIGTSVDGLQTTDVAIFAMLPWKADDFVQWRGRFDRIGGTPTVLEIPIAIGTYDERVVTVLSEKFGNIEEMFAAEEIAGLDDKMAGTEDRQAGLAAMLDSLLGGME